MNEVRKHTLIIGAGAAGIAAATKLYENGITDIIVIEAEKRIGGRIHTVITPDGDLLEMGAAYIHKRPANCVLDLAESHGKCVASSVTFENMIYARSSGELVKKDMSEMMRQAFRGLHKDFAASEETAQCSLSHYVSKNFPDELNKVEYDHIPHEVKQEFIENANHFLRSHYTRDMLHEEQERTPEVESPFECNQPGTFALWKDEGFKTLLDLLLENCPETFVKEFCCLGTEVEHVSKTADEELRVRCSSDVTYIVTHVICTVSLGVLQNSYQDIFEKFLLPEEKIRAIRGITIGTIDKIYLRFSDIWWPERGCNGFALLWTKQDRREFKEKGPEWVTGIFAITRVDFSPHVLVAWISGEAAKVMETVGEEEVRETILSVLRKFLGAHFAVADIVKCYRSKWYKNEHFRGSYGFRNLPKDVEEVWSDQMARPVCNHKGIPILLFAGEASDPDFYSTVHGAVGSGWREADRIISLTNSSPEQSCSK